MVLVLSVTTNAQQVCIIVNKNNPVSSLSLNDLRRIYLSMRSNWNYGKKIITTIPPIGTQERNLFIVCVIGFKPEDFITYFDKEKMKGNIVTKPISLNSDLAIQRFIQKNPDAIGIINTSSYDSTSVKVLKINGFLPNEEKYPIRKR
jgi:ABC-type phosphate transport system substrate-binding protein